MGSIFADEQQRISFVAERRSRKTRPPEVTTIAEYLESIGKTLPQEEEGVMIEELDTEDEHSSAVIQGMPTPAPLSNLSAMHTQSVTTTRSTTSSPSRTTSCSGCKRGRSNSNCEDHLCQACCAQTLNSCSVSTHKSAKRQRRPPPFANMINEAITQGRLVHLAYDGGSTPKRVRILQPKKWVTEWVSFAAIEHGTVAALEKTYCVDKISRCEWQEWD
jgi:hypothetical protein